MCWWVIRVIWEVYEHTSLGGDDVLLADELIVHPGVGDVSLCMDMCFVEEWEEVFRCIASLD